MMSKLNSEPKFCEVVHPTTKEKFLLPNSLNQKNMDSAARYKAKDTDVFVCSFPKCGTTWTQNIVWLILHEGETFSGYMSDVSPMLVFKGSEAAEAIDDSVYPRIIKTHLPYSMTPKNPNAKYIYITRNPKDALVSHYYHVKGFEEHYECPDVTLNDVFLLYVAGKVEFNSYFDHVVEWYSKRNESNILFLLYEDLKRDLKSNVMRIARFLGSDYEEKLLANDEEVLGKVLEQSSFKTMHKQRDKWISSDRPDDLPFIRKGQVGDWKNHLTNEQSLVIDQILKDRGIDNLWQNYPEVH